MPDWKQHVRAALAHSRDRLAREEEIVEELAQYLEDRFSEDHLHSACRFEPGGLDEGGAEGGRGD